MNSHVTPRCSAKLSCGRFSFCLIERLNVINIKNNAAAPVPLFQSHGHTELAILAVLCAEAKELSDTTDQAFRT